MIIKNIYIINGPNINILGNRENCLYGIKSMAEIESMCHLKAKKIGLNVEFRQTNCEGILVDWIQESGIKSDGLLINAAAYTHTSIAIYDALKAINIPKIEIHMTIPENRECFRKQSFVTPCVDGKISGFLHYSYLAGIDAIRYLIDSKKIT